MARTRTNFKPSKSIGKTCQNWHTQNFIKNDIRHRHEKYMVVKNEWETLYKNAIRVANNTPQHEILNIPVRLKAHLAAQKTHVRETIGITVQKHAPQNEIIQVKNSLFEIVLSPMEK